MGKMWSIETLVGSSRTRAAAEIYASTWGHDAEEALTFVRQSLTMRGFVGRVGVEQRSDSVVGMGFGARALPGLWWRDRVADTIGHAHPALKDAWVLGELAVRPSWRGQGVGSALHDALLRAQPCPRVLLTTQVGNHDAQRFYRHRGWRVLHRGFAFVEGSTPFMVMSREMDLGMEFL